MRFLLELDPNVVKPGWTPLLITIGIALVMVLLYRSMRRQFRRVDDNFPEPTRPVGAVPAESAEGAPVDDASPTSGRTGADPMLRPEPGQGNR